MKKKGLILFFVLLVGLVLLSNCRPPEVEGIVLNIQRGLYEEALQLAQEAVQKYPENAEAWYYLGWLYGRQGEYEKMNEAFDEVLSLNPQQQVSYDSQKKPADRAIEAIRNIAFADNFNAATASYNRARNIEDEAQRQEMYRDAVRKFLAAHQAHPRRNEPYKPLAMAYLMSGDTLSAEKTFMKAVELQPQNDTLLVIVGDFYLQTNNFDKAEEFYKKALEVNPDFTQIYLALGQIQVQRQEWEKAVEFFSKAMELDPNNSSISFNIGVIYYNLDKYQEAIPYLKKTLELEPDNKQIYEVLGLCYVQTEMFDEALPLLEDGVKKFPDNASLWNYLGIVYARKGLKEKAEEAFNKQKELEKM